MERSLLVCVPGPWEDGADLVRRVIVLEPKGQFVLAGGVLADIADKDHVALEFHPSDTQMRTAFELAGQGKLSESILSAIEQHRSVAYLRFPLRLRGERHRILKFTDVLRRTGGFALKVESAGVAHTWKRWSALLGGSEFDLYCASVGLFGGNDRYYSCGMRHFGLAECSVSRFMELAEAADLMNRFNYWRIIDDPVLTSGHIFSLAPDAPRYRLTLEQDRQHSPDDMFFNSHGVWFLDAA